MKNISGNVKNRLRSHSAALSDIMLLLVFRFLTLLESDHARIIDISSLLASVLPAKIQHSQTGVVKETNETLGKKSLAVAFVA